MKRTIEANPLAALLIIFYAYLFAVLLTHQHAWMSPEEFCIKTYILEKGASWDDLRRGLNYIPFEYAERTFRPFSSYFEILDTRFRVWLWQFIVPHPSLSLTWLFSLALTPLLLFKVLRHFKVSANLAFGGVTLFLANPANLSHVVWRFRPGKPMTTFSLVLCLYLATKVRDLRGFVGLLLVIVFSCLWDESAVLIFPVVLVLFPELLSKDRRRWVAAAAMPFALGLCWFALLPELTVLAGYPRPHLFEYGPTATLAHGSFDFVGAVLHLLANTRLLVTDSLGLVYPGHILSTEAPLLSAAVWLLVLATAALLIRRRAKRRAAGPPLRRVLVCLAGLALGQALLLESVTNKVWGLYWYGALWTAPFALLICLALADLKLRPPFVFAGLGLVTCSLLTTFPALNFVYKAFHFYPGNPLTIREFFENKRDRFAYYQEHATDIPGLYEMARQTWLERDELRHSRRRVVLPKELYFILPELEIVHDRWDVCAASIGQNRYLDPTAHRTGQW